MKTSNKINWKMSWREKNNLLGIKWNYHSFPYKAIYVTVWLWKNCNHNYKCKELTVGMKVFDQTKTDNCKNSKDREEKVNSVR